MTNGDSEGGEERVEVCLCCCVSFDSGGRGIA